MLPYVNLIEALNAAPGERPFVTHWVDQDEQHTVTFAEFRRAARVQAAELKAAGVEPGDRVIVIMPQSVAAMTCFIGVMMAGAVPAYLAYPNFKIEPSKYRAGLAGASANLSAKAVIIDTDFPEDMLEHVSVPQGARLVRASANASVDSRAIDLPKVSPRDIAFIQHSAGTTGLQKGVALTHEAVLRQIELLRERLEISNQDRVYSWLPLYHDMGLIACFMLPLACHIPVVLQSPLEWVMQPESMLAAISECKCSLAWMPNFAFQFLPRRTPEERRKTYDLSPLRALINCSEPVHASSMREFREAFAERGLREGVLRTSYAMAENVFAVTQSGPVPREVWVDGARFRSEQLVDCVPPGTAGARTFVSSGQLLPGHQLRIVDRKRMQEVEGRVGEIEIASDCLFAGYFNRPDLTTEALQDGWYRTGDLGFVLDEDLFVVGRKKDLIIVGGENLYPEDIERAVMAHPAVADGRVVALGLYNSASGTEDVVVVAEAETETLLNDSEEVEQGIRESLVGSTGVAARWIFLKPPRWIVKSTAGKAARSATREKLLLEHPELATEKAHDK